MKRLITKCLATVQGKSKHEFKPELYSGVDGQPPTCSYVIVPPSDVLIASTTGPENGIVDFLPLVKEFHVDLNQHKEFAYGRSISLYDATPSGVRAGDPIADCYATLCYEHHTLLVVADGVGWGEPAKRAARCAVLGVTSFLHRELPGMGLKDSSPVTTDQVFQLLLRALGPAQDLILAQSGTLTTLVVTVVARLAVPLRRDGSTVHASSPAARRLRDCSASFSSGKYLRWVALTMNIGDSGAFVYRRVEDSLQELSYDSSQAGCYRDPRFTPGALGFASGREPDLSNLGCTLSPLNEGDIVFLTSDGVIDNFNPFILKLAQQSFRPRSYDFEAQRSDASEDRTDGQLPALTPRQSHIMQHDLMTQAARKAHGCSKVLPPDTGVKDVMFSARLFADGLLEHVTMVTEEQRQYAQEKEIARMQRQNPRDDSLETGGIRCYSKEMLIPGKMDHATIAAYAVGGGR